MTQYTHRNIKPVQPKSAWAVFQAYVFRHISDHPDLPRREYVLRDAAKEPWMKERER